MSKHRLTTITGAAYLRPDVLELLIILNTLTGNQDRVLKRIKDEVTATGKAYLGQKHRDDLHEAAEMYADQTLAYAQEYSGGYDRTPGDSPAMLLIQTADHITREIAAELQIPDQDHDLWAIGRAALAVFTWLRVCYGRAEAERRYAAAVRAARAVRPRSRQPAAVL